MFFSAKQALKAENIILYCSCSGKTLDEMYGKTKNALKFTGVVPNGTELNEDLAALKQYSKEDLLSMKSLTVIIAMGAHSRTKKIAEYFRENKIAYDHISCYSHELSVNMLNTLGYNDYEDYHNNRVTFEDIGGTGSVIVKKDSSYSTDNKVCFGRIFVTNHLSVALYGKNSNTVIGNSAFFQVNIGVSTNGSVEIGDECMFSHSIDLSQSDQHLIFDFNTKERINVGKNIKIGNHVWIGRSVSLLGGCNIPDNCIVGANTVTSHRFTEANCIIAGNPGKIIRKNIIWSSDSQRLDRMTFDECNDQSALKYI